MSAIFETLDAAGIPIIQVADSTMSISCLVPEANLEQAVRLLHDAFGLSGTQA
jgi:aspartate kinase